MGLIFSCLGFGHGDQEPGPVLQSVVNKCKSLFHSGQAEVATPSNEAGAATTDSATATTTPAAIALQREAQTSQLSSSTDNIHSDSQQNGLRELVKPPNKAVAQIGDNVALQQNSVVQQGSKTLAKETEKNKVKQWADFDYSSELFPSSNDEDVCPTCLEEYDEENPKIMTQCNHHYHLACILEWMERSASCPVCSKLMVFEQIN